MPDRSDFLRKIYFLFVSNLFLLSTNSLTLLFMIIGHSSARERRQARRRRRTQDCGEHIHSPPTPWFPSTAPITQLLLYPSPSFAQHRRGRIFSNTRCPPKKCDLLLVNLTSSVCRIISTCKSNLLACLGHLIHLIQLL